MNETRLDQGETSKGVENKVSGNIPALRVGVRAVNDSSYKPAASL